MKIIYVTIFALYSIKSPSPNSIEKETQNTNLNDISSGENYQTENPIEHLIETTFDKIKPFLDGNNDNASYQSISKDILNFLKLLSTQNYNNYYNHFHINTQNKLIVLAIFLKTPTKQHVYEYDKYEAEIKKFLKNNFTNDEKKLSKEYFWENLNALQSLDGNNLKKYQIFIKVINSFINNLIEKISNYLSIITDISFHPILYKEESYENLMIIILNHTEELKFFLDEKKLIEAKLYDLFINKMQINQ